MRIVLLGATGFLGHHLLPVLSAAGHDCLALCRNRMARRDLAVIPRVELRQTDVHDTERLTEALRGADAVINMIGILNESGRRGRGFQRAHVELAERLIEACRAAGVRRLVQVSALNAGQGESHYLASKGEAEALLRQAADIDSTILQPSVIFGEGDGFFNRFAGLLRFAPMLPLACPDARLQPVWVGDVAAAIAAVLVDDSTIGQTLVLVGPKEYSLRELVEFTAATIGLRRRIVGLPDALARLQGLLMDFVPGKPFSTDNYKSLQIPNTSRDNDLPRLGIRPRPLEAEVPSYLVVSPHQRHLADCRSEAHTVNERQ
jgi:NADH dehydrogenase